VASRFSDAHVRTRTDRALELFAQALTLNSPPGTSGAIGDLETTTIVNGGFGGSIFDFPGSAPVWPPRLPGVSEVGVPGGLREPLPGPRFPPGTQVLKMLKDPPKPVMVSDLNEEDRTCPICYTEYNTTNDAGVKESPVRTHCGHVHGEKCLEKWIVEGNWSCPHCRAKFQPAEGISTVTMRDRRWTS
jgi:hypothetical protein